MLQRDEDEGFLLLLLNAEVEFQLRLWKRKETLEFYTGGADSRSP